MLTPPFARLTAGVFRAGTKFDQAEWYRIGVRLRKFSNGLLANAGAELALDPR